MDTKNAAKSRTILNSIKVRTSRVKATSDFDYVIKGINSRQWSKIKNSLPGAPSRIDNLPRRIDLFRGPLDPTKPHITIYPR